MSGGSKSRGTLQVQGCNIAYTLYGASGPLVICVNGIAQTIASQLPLVKAFKEGFRVLAYDPPGHGASVSENNNRYYDYIALTQVLEGLVVAFSATHEKVFMIASSFGAVVACNYAARRPHKVKGLILGSLSIRPNLFLRNQQLDLLKIIEQNNRSQLAEKMASYGALGLSPYYQKKIQEQFLAMPEHQIETFRLHLHWLVALDDKPAGVAFESITAETLIVVGSNDPLINHEDIRDISLRIASCKIDVIEGAGHYMHLEENFSFMTGYFRRYFEGVLRGECCTG
jgi:pimeloyl-ACP methyl ester carboxylesterase